MSKQNRNTKSQSRSALLAQLRTPFANDGHKWPDDRTSLSSVITSRTVYTYFPYRQDAVSTSTTHYGGVVMYPNPFFASSSLADVTAGANILTDLENPAGTVRNLGSVPNIAAIRAAYGVIRCCGMAVKVTYEGTELNRAGRYFAGTPNVVNTPAVTVVTGTQMSGVSTWTSTNSTTASMAEIQQSSRNVTTARISDGSFVAHWIPTKVPAYMSLSQNAGPSTTAPGTQPAAGSNTVLNALPGAFGVETGQTALVVIIDGDVTAAATANGNPYNVEMIWHWEYIPENLYTSIVPLTPSPFLPLDLATVLNNLQLSPSAFVAASSGDGTFGTPYRGGRSSGRGNQGKKLVAAAQKAAGQTQQAMKLLSMLSRAVAPSTTRSRQRLLTN